MAEETYEGQFYCVKCRDHKQTSGKVVITAKGGRAAKAECPDCGTKLNRFLPSK